MWGCWNLFELRCIVTSFSMAYSCTITPSCFHPDNQINYFWQRKFFFHIASFTNKDMRQKSVIVGRKSKNCMTNSREVSQNYKKIKKSVMTEKTTSYHLSKRAGNNEKQLYCLRAR